MLIFKVNVPDLIQYLQDSLCFSSLDIGLLTLSPFLICTRLNKQIFEHRM